MTYRVIQWATGGVGRAAIEGIVRHPDLELVGCWVHSEAKRGLDVGEILGTGPIGVRATTSRAEIIALDADAVVYAPVYPDPADVDALLRSGKNVVTPLGWFYPPESSSTDRMRDACIAGGTSLHGTGIDPGGATDLHPLFFSRHSSAVTFARGEEFSDIRTYNSPEVIRDFMGFGGTPEQAMQGPMAGLLDGGFRQSVQMILDGLRFGAAEVRVVQDVAVATEPIADTPIGTIDTGQVAARRFHWEAVVHGQVVVRLGVNWFMGQQSLEPAWTMGSEGERFEVEIKGDPDAFVVIHGWHPTSVEEGLRRNPGIVVTAMHCVNSIPYVCAAEPGIRTYFDLPMVLGRAHPDFGR